MTTRNSTPLDDHPIVTQLGNLSLSYDRIREELYRNSVKLQRHYLDSSNEHDRIQRLERENETLKEELAILRAVPHPDSLSSSHPAVLQSQQLTISLRKLSDQLSLTEDALLTRTTELTHSKREATKSKLDAEKAYELAARIRGREEAGKQRERDLEWKLRMAEEEKRMNDKAMNEYASLVRSLETRMGKRPSLSIPREQTPPVKMATIPVDNSELISELRSEVEKLQSQLDNAQAEHASLEAKYEAERKAADLDRMSKATAEFELEKLRVEDNTATKMVARYMKFSQSSTDTLQTSLVVLKTRHAATIDSLTAQVFDLTTQLQGSQTSLERFRGALDELGGELMKESFGRRNEVALRIRMVTREERLNEALQRWLRRSEESLGRVPEGKPGHEALVSMAQDARILLTNLDAPWLKSESSDDKALMISGTLARMVAAQYLVDEMKDELKDQNTKNLQMRRLISELGGEMPEHLLPEDQWVPPEGWMSTVLNVHDHPPISPAPPAVPLRSADPALAGSPSPRTDTLSPLQVSIDSGTSVPESVELSDTGDTTPIPSNLHSISTDGGNSIPSTLPTLPRDSPVEATPLMEQHLETVVNYNVSDVPQVEAIPESHMKREVDNPTPTLFPEITSQSSADPINSDETSTPTAERIPRTPFPLESPNPVESFPAVQNSLPYATELLSPAPSIHPLLPELAQIPQRYDSLQRAFRDCHLALQSLKESLVPPTIPGQTPSFISAPSLIPREAVEVALGRLYDFIEDARVELEIQISDETLLAKGYETLLSIPGALAAVSPSPSSSTLFLNSLDRIKDDYPPSQSEMERQIHAFIAGTDENVIKARDTFTRKLEDVQHDVAALKRAVHDPEAGLLSPSSPPPASPASSSTISAPSLYTAPRHPVNRGEARSSSWTSWIRHASSPVSPPPQPQATFGDIMTSPRLRHSPSMNAMSGGGLRRDTAGSEAMNDVLGSLGLRVPMPRFSGHVGRQEFNGGVTAPIPGPQRTRTISTMYMLGLGARNPLRPTTRQTPLANGQDAVGLVEGVNTGAAGAFMEQHAVSPGRDDIDGDTDVETETDTETDLETDTEDDDTDIE